MSRNQARKPKGTPVGGQFDRTLGGGPAANLDEPERQFSAPFMSEKHGDYEIALYQEGDKYSYQVVHAGKVLDDYGDNYDNANDALEDARQFVEIERLGEPQLGEASHAEKFAVNYDQMMADLRAKARKNPAVHKAANGALVRGDRLFIDGRDLSPIEESEAVKLVKSPNMWEYVGHNELGLTVFKKAGEK